MKISRRRWLMRSLIYGIPIAAGLWETRHLSITRAEVALGPSHAGLDGLKLALLSDFHHDDYGSRSLVRRAVAAANAAEVDLVLLLGDYISDDPSAIVPLCEELQALKARLGVFGIMGNHDDWHLNPIIHESLQKAGVRVLINEPVDFPGFTLLGMDSVFRGGATLPFLLESLPPDRPVLLARHEPDTFDLDSDARVALQVSGHSHGGQICAPFYGPIFLPGYGRKYPHGLYRKGPSSLFTTRGIGTLKIPVRILAAPELALLSLKA